MTDAVSILEPKTRDELAEAVLCAARDRVPVFPTGGAGVPPHLPGGARAISTKLLDRIVAHEPGDLTLTAEAGLTIEAAQELLAQYRQFLAFDPPDPSRATIGSVVASGSEGPLAARFGAVRDQLLGLTVVNGDGRVTRCGGRVVKNVTGYDLARLYAGSRGGLAIVVEATVRIRPLPERVLRLDRACADEADAFERAWRLRSRVPEIASIQIRRGDACVLTAILAGLGPFVDAAGAEVEAILGGPATEVACDVRSFRVARPPEGARTVSVAALPADWRTLPGELAPLLSPPLGWIHDVLRGVRESWHAPDRPPFLDERKLDALLERAGASIDCPDDPAFQRSVGARFRSQVPGGLELMRKLKAALDPAGILNPGMTVYG